MGKLLLIAGLIIAAVGLLMMMGLPIGRLPGDIACPSRQRHVLLSARDVDRPEHPAVAGALHPESLMTIA